MICNNCVKFQIDNFKSNLKSKSSYNYAASDSTLVENFFVKIFKIENKYKTFTNS